MKTLKSKSPHRPKDMLVDINDDNDVEKILETKEFIKIDEIKVEEKIIKKNELTQVRKEKFE